MAERILDPSGNLYNSFMKIINSITIKYVYHAEKYETMETKLSADQYLDALNKLDTFFSYSDYTSTEFHNVGLHDSKIINEALNGNLNAVPKQYRDSLLQVRRERVLNLFEEKNNYYRMLYGLPDLEDKDFFYASQTLVAEFNIDPKVPIHQIQDYYNKQENGRGDYLISVIEGTGYIEKLCTDHPEKKYLKYLGSNRIDIYTSRMAKNFQVIQVRKPDVRQSILDIFIRVYEQCREYYVKTLYISTYSKFLDFYDNFIAMCIMIMTLQQVATKQIPLGIKREFFDVDAVRALYEAYDVPYNLNIDEDTQTDIVQNLNVLIQNKATDKVIYNIANLLGFTNVNVYKYYLTKEHKMDMFNVPIFKYTTRFNPSTGETETVPDYQSMYDLYFQKFKLGEQDFVNSFNDNSNRVEYKDVTSQDAFWWEDQNVYERIWETEYNFVESKYLSLGISYSMTEIMFENVIFLKLILNDGIGVKNLNISLPKIVEGMDVPLFDVIILLLCLLSVKHKLWGEVISVPTQVISVMDYIKNTDRGDAHHDTFKFNFNYFFNPAEFEDKDKMDEMKNDLINHMNNPDKNDIDTIGFNFDVFSTSNPERQKNIATMKRILGEDDYNKFLVYVEKLSPITTGSNTERVKTLNEMFNGITGIFRLINFYLTKTNDRDNYESLKRLYYSLFVSREMSEVFEITTDVLNPETQEHETITRTAWTYFEYLYHKNPKLYTAVFQFDLSSAFIEYTTSHPEASSMSFYEFSLKVAKGEIYLDYGKMLNETADDYVKEETIYTHVNHILSRLEMILDDVKFMYAMNDTATPLETLLMQLIRFFKSYTVDILDLDTIYVCDFKPANMIKLTEKIAYMEKGIDVSEEIPLSYSDVINKISSDIYPNDAFGMKDHVVYNANIELSDRCSISDKIHKMWYTE